MFATHTHVCRPFFSSYDRLSPPRSKNVIKNWFSSKNKHKTRNVDTRMQRKVGKFLNYANLMFSKWCRATVKKNKSFQRLFLLGEKSAHTEINPQANQRKCENQIINFFPFSNDDTNLFVFFKQEDSVQGSRTRWSSFFIVWSTACFEMVSFSFQRPKCLRQSMQSRKYSKITRVCVANAWWS